jgi:hypothetical protein
MLHIRHPSVVPEQVNRQRVGNRTPRDTGSLFDEGVMIDEAVPIDEGVTSAMIPERETRNRRNSIAPPKSQRRNQAIVPYDRVSGFLPPPTGPFRGRENRLFLTQAQQVKSLCAAHIATTKKRGAACRSPPDWFVD